MSASLRKRPKCCVAARRRYVPIADIAGIPVRRPQSLIRWSISRLGECVLNDLMLLACELHRTQLVGELGDLASEAER